MDTNVVTDVSVAASADEVMQTLHAARQVIHEMFFDVAEPIIALMDPVEEP
jgi:hypothetical protein